MSSLRLLLGLIPSTSKIEQAEKALIAEYENLALFKIGSAGKIYKA
jgi:hypothetical protein